MFLSIIVPIYNSEQTIHRCLNSIIDQSFRDWELILVNDCSNDNTIDVCEEYALRDDRIRVLNNETNRGVSYSRNYGMQAAKGEWIMFVDSDDWLDVNYIRDILPSANTDIVISSFEYIGEKNYKVPIISAYYDSEHISSYLTNYCTKFTSPWAKLYRTSIISKFHITFNENICHGEDTIFLYDYILHAGAIETKTSCGYFYACDIEGSLSKKPKGLTQYIEIINMLNGRIHDMEIKYNWDGQRASIILTEYFLSRYIRQLFKGDKFYKEKVNDLQILLKMSYHCCPVKVPDDYYKV